MKKIFVKVVPNSKNIKIEKISEDHFKIWTNKKPTDNEANYSVVEILAEYFDVPKSDLIIKSGQKSRDKVVLIELS